MNARIHLQPLTVIITDKDENFTDYTHQQHILYN